MVDRSVAVVILLAIVFALGSALSTALSTSLQHHAVDRAGQVAEGASMLRRLLHQPGWLVGQVLGLGAFGFHAAAMGHGPITLVQPIVISGIALAVPVRSAISRSLPGRSEIFAVVLTVASLAAFLLASHPRQGPDVGTGWRLAVPVLVAMVVAFAGAIAARRVRNLTYRAFALGTMAGLLFGFVAVLLKAAQIVSARDGGVAALTSWLIPALVVAGLGGVVVNQFSYSVGRLSASMPVLNVVNAGVALASGWLIFQETPRHSGWALVVEMAAVVGLCVGLWILARYEPAPEGSDEVRPTA